MWRASRIVGGITPFSDELLNLTIPQIDFIIEMGAQDDPSLGTFQRMGEIKTVSEPERLAAWHKVLRGKGAKAIMGKMMPSAAVLKRAAELADAVHTLGRASRKKE